MYFMIFFLLLEKELNITAIIQHPSSASVHRGNLVTLHCSVLFNAGKNTCESNHRVYWFRTGSDQSHPSLVYAQRNSGDECERSPEASSGQKCLYSFSKYVSASDAGTYYCAVATCGQILFGNGTTLDSKGKALFIKNIYNLVKKIEVIKMILGVCFNQKY